MVFNIMRQPSFSDAIRSSKFNKNMTIGEVIRQDPNTAALLNQYGMHCTSCPFSQMESLEQAGQVHGCDVDALVKALNEHFAKKA